MLSEKNIWGKSKQILTIWENNSITWFRVIKIKVEFAWITTGKTWMKAGQGDDQS